MPTRARAYLWVNKNDVVARRALANAARREPYTRCRQVLDCRLQVVNPEPNVVKRRRVNLG